MVLEDLFDFSGTMALLGEEISRNFDKALQNSEETELTLEFAQKVYHKLIREERIDVVDSVTISSSEELEYLIRVSTEVGGAGYEKALDILASLDYWDCIPESRRTSGSIGSELSLNALFDAYRTSPNSTAAHEFVTQITPRLNQILRSRLYGKTNDIDDLRQEVLLRLFQMCPGSKLSFSWGLLSTTASGKAVDHQRHRTAAQRDYRRRQPLTTGGESDGYIFEISDPLALNPMI